MDNEDDVIRDALPPAAMHGPYTVPVVCGLLVLGVAVVFGQSLWFSFTNFDDPEFVFANAHVTGGLTRDGVIWAFTTRGDFNPLTWLSHMLDCQIFGLHPWGHHLVNVLLHATASVLLFRVLNEMTRELWPSAVVAAVFAIHPLRAESVAWVAERKDVLSGCFFMLAVGAYVRYARHPFSLPRYLAVCGLVALGLLAKPMLVTLPCLFLVLDFWPLRRMEAGRTSRLWLMLEKLPLLALSAAASAATLWSQHQSVAMNAVYPFPVRLANALVSYASYLAMFVYPFGLDVFYPHPGAALPMWKVLASAAVLIAITAGALASWRKRPYLLAGWLWYLGMLVPVIGLLQTGAQAMADRYTYLSQIGVCIALVWGIKQAFESWPSRQLIYKTACAVALVSLMVIGIVQTSTWRNSETLWRHALACNPRNSVAHFDLAAELGAHGKTDEAIVHYQQAVNIEPNYVEAHLNLAVALAGRGQMPAAISHFRKAVEINPFMEEAHCNLGVALASSGQMDEAIVHFRKALELNPDSPLARQNLNQALLEKRK